MTIDTIPREHRLREDPRAAFVDYLATQVHRIECPRNGVVLPTEYPSLSAALAEIHGETRWRRIRDYRGRVVHEINRPTTLDD